MKEKERKKERKKEKKERKKERKKEGGRRYAPRSYAPGIKGLLPYKGLCP